MDGLCDIYEHLYNINRTKKIENVNEQQLLNLLSVDIVSFGGQATYAKDQK